LILTRINVNTKSKLNKPKLARFTYLKERTNDKQQKRVDMALAGRLLVDTFVHSKDVIKETDYSLKSMSKYIKPEVRFNYLGEEEIV